MEVPPFPKVKLSTIDPFDGSRDPDAHLSVYKHQMYVQAVDDATLCKNFPATLKGVAQKVFYNLSPNSVNNFKQLSYLSLVTLWQIGQNRKQACTWVIQGTKEALRSSVNRFNLEALQIHDLNDGVAFNAFIRG